MSKGKVMSFNPVLGTFMTFQLIPTRAKTAEGEYNARTEAAVNFIVIF